MDCFFFSILYKRKLNLVRILFLLLVLCLVACTRGYQTSSKGIWHTVKSNETLEKISRKYSVSSKRIQKENDIYDPEDLSAGMRIFIPGVRRADAPKHVPKVSSRRISGKLGWPAAGTISSGFGKRHGRMHEGIDITRDKGTQIRAAENGVVVFAGNKGSFGKVIMIDHGKGLKTLYAHNSVLYVKKGTRVRRGAVIAKMGSTGRSTGIHLHFEVQINDKAVNPLRYLQIR